MNAMPARNLKYKTNDDIATSVTPNRRKARDQKVIELPLPKKSKFKGLSPRKQEELVLEYRMKARKLARSILRKWHARLDLQEVDSVVDLSLCEAVRRYNPNKGASFMTFLFYHMRGNLIRAVAAAATANAVPYAAAETEEGAGQQADQASYRGVNAIEIAEALCSHDYVMPDENLLKKEMVSISQDACEKLDSLEKEVIYRIYIQEQQLMDIASSLGYSRCHISRVKKKALETLYGDMSSAIHKGDEESIGPRPDFDDENGSGERRKIHRRRPRSRKATRVLDNVVEAQF